MGVDYTGKFKSTMITHHLSAIYPNSRTFTLVGYYFMKKL